MTSATTSACPRGAPHLPWQHPVTSVPLPLPGPKRRHLPRWPRCLAAVTGCPETCQSAEVTGSTGDWQRRLAQATGRQAQVPVACASAQPPLPLCATRLPSTTLGHRLPIPEAWAGLCKARLRASRGQPQKEAKAGGGGVKGRAIHAWISVTCPTSVVCTLNTLFCTYMII